jgi:F0F1-type ATP synthase membrane subunit c/vacuolar-type H+-ATPase subunit K
MEFTPVLAVVLFITAAAAAAADEVRIPTNINGQTETTAGAITVAHTTTSTSVASGVTATSAVPSASESSSQKSSKTPVGAIVGGVIGGIALLAIVGAVVFFYMRRKKGRRLRSDMGDERGGVLDKNLSLEDQRISGSASALATAGQGMPMMTTYDRSARGDGERTRGDVDGGAASPHERGGSRLDAPLENRTHEVLVSPAEIHSREVDEDGVSVQSFDMHGTSRESSVPRLPLYTRDSAA